MLSCHFDVFEQKLATFFRRYVRVVTHWPLPFIVVPVTVALLMSYGFIWSFELVKDDLDLYTPTDSPSKSERADLQRLFPIHENDTFFAMKRFTVNRMGYIIMKTVAAENIISVRYFAEAVRLWDRVERMAFINTDGELYSYRSLCILAPPIDSRIIPPDWHFLTVSAPSCVKNFLLDFYRLLYDPSKKEHSRLFEMLQLSNYPDFEPWYIEIMKLGGSFSDMQSSGNAIHYGNLIGKPINLIDYLEVENDTSKLQQLIQTRALLLPYQLKYESAMDDKLAEKWETFLDKMLSDITVPNISLHWWTSETLTIETRKDVNVLLQMLVPMFTLVTIFTIGCTFVNNCLRSKPWLGLCGVISSGLSVVSSMGILLMCGAKLNSVTYFVPFLTFSIGVDNIFIFIGAWRKTNVFDSVEERMVRTFDDAAVSITVTALTDAVSFAIGISSMYPSVRYFCLYSCFAICFVYINQLTFFTGCMVVSGIRESKFQNCVTLRVMPDVRDRILKKAPKRTAKPRLRLHHIQDVTEEGIADHAAARFFKGPYASFLMHGVTKTLVFILLFLYLATAVWGVRHIFIGVHPTMLVSEKSLARKTLDVYHEHFSTFGDNLHVWFTDLEKYTTDYEFWTNSIKAEVNRFQLVKYSFTADYWWSKENIFNNLWYKHDNRTALKFAKINDSKEFEKLFLEFVQVYVDIYKHYEKDVRFEKVNRKDVISAVRFQLRLFNVTSVNQYVATHQFRQLAKESKFNCRVYHQFFEFGDQFDSIVPSLFSNMGYGSLAVVAACLLLIPKPMCAVWVCVTIVSINVGVLGFMSLWGVHLDFISMVTIVMSIGASVDFSAHIAYHFAKTDLPRVKDRVRDSLYVVGTPIMQSAFSTWLGILLIVVIESYTFRAFVKTSSLVILFGLLHGLVVLPVLLSVFHWEKNLDAPTSTTTATENNSSERPLELFSETKEKSGLVN